MAAFINDRVFDLGLTILDTEATGLYICNALPTTYTEAVTTYGLGSKTGISFGAPANGATSGRRVTIAAITDGSVTATGTATHWAVVDSVNSRLLATHTLTTSFSVTSGNAFTLDDQDVEIPDPASGTLHDRVYDNGLTVLDTEADDMTICSTLPTTYAEATATYLLGIKTGITIGAPQDGASSGRRVITSAITDGTCSTGGTAAYFAIVDNGASRLLVAKALSNSQVVTPGNVLIVASQEVLFPDPV